MGAWFQHGAARTFPFWFRPAGGLYRHLPQEEEWTWGYTFLHPLFTWNPTTNGLWFEQIITGGDVSEQYFETLGVCRRETELSFLLSGHSGCPLPPRISEGASLLSSSVQSCQRFCKIVKFSRGLPTLTQERRFNINSFLCRQSYTNQAYWKKIWQLWKKRLRWHSPLSFFLSAFMKVQNDTIAEVKGEIQMYNRTIRHIEELTKKNQANLT